MIELNNLSKWYGSVQALESFSAEIDSGATVGLLGSNGAGKTTLLRILAGFRYPTGGRARVCGHDVVESSMPVRRCVGYLPEAVPLYDDLIPDTYLQYRGRLKGLSGAELRDRVQTVLDLCGLDDVRSRPASALSKGYRKRLGLADALIAEPEVLLLDEPTEGLDPNQVRDTRRLIRDLSNDRTLLLSSHILSDVERTCNRVLILSGGRLVYDGDPERQQDENRPVEIRMGVADGSAKTIQSALLDLDVVRHVERLGKMDGAPLLFRITSDVDARTELFEVCAERGWPLEELGLEQPSLETLFHRSTE